MSSDIIQADYEALAALAQRFGTLGETTAELRQRLAQRAEALTGSWRGRGGHAFQAEMQGDLLPALQRLAEALAEAGRTFAWLGRNRRLSKDYERDPYSSQAFIYLASIQLLLKRLHPG